MWVGCLENVVGCLENVIPAWNDLKTRDMTLMRREKNIRMLVLPLGSTMVTIRAKSTNAVVMQVLRPTDLPHVAWVRIRTLCGSSHVASCCSRTRWTFLSVRQARAPPAHDSVKLPITGVTHHNQTLMLHDLHVVGQSK